MSCLWGGRPIPVWVSSIHVADNGHFGGHVNAPEFGRLSVRGSVVMVLGNLKQGAILQ